MKIKALYHRLFPAVYNYVFYKTLSRRQTEEIVSRFFLQILENSEAMEENGAFDRFLAAADSMVADFRRTLSPADSGIMQEEISESVGKQALSLLRQLPEKDRMYVYYHYYLGNGSAPGCPREYELSADFARIQPEISALLD